MVDPTDDLWKIFGMIGMVGGGVIWALKLQSNKTKSDQINKSEHDRMDRLIKEQEGHIEFQDKKIENFSSKLDRISEQINQFGVFDLKIKQLESENVERKDENKIIMRKLDGIFNKMNQMEVTMNNKANRT